MWSPTQASCCDQGFRVLARHIVVSPVRGFSITASRAQAVKTQAAAISIRYLEGIFLIVGGLTAMRSCQRCRALNRATNLLPAPGTGPPYPTSGPPAPGRERAGLADTPAGR